MKEGLIRVFFSFAVFVILFAYATPAQAIYNGAIMTPAFSAVVLIQNSSESFGLQGSHKDPSSRTPYLSF